LRPEYDLRELLKHGVRGKYAARYRQPGRSDWFVASILLRFEYVDEDRSNPRRRCLAHENTHLIRATSPQVAYRKALRIGRAWAADPPYRNIEGKLCRWRFVGLTNLLPVYEPLEDGAEVFWTEHSNRQVSTIERLVRAKEQLQAFQQP